MATTTETAPAAVSTQGIDIKKFPDGLKTSGQHAPVLSQIWPYEKFPKTQTGPTLWKAEDYRNNPEKWTHRFTDEEIQEIGEAADNFIKNNELLTGISRVSHTCSRMSLQNSNLF